MFVAKYRLTYYLLFAATFFSFWFLFKLGGIPDFRYAVLSTLIDVVITMTALLLTMELLLPQFFDHDRYNLFFGGVILTIALCGSVIIISQLKLQGYSLADYHQNIKRYKEHYFYWFWSDLVLGSYFLTGFVSFGGFAIRMAFDRIKSERKMAVLEKEKMRLELDSLKNQINPHFLFNALNTIYYKIDKSNLPARTLTEQFSSLLRYQLTECNEQFVAIEKELKFVNDYVELQKGRLSANVLVNSLGIATIAGFQISPYLLMPLVENCFKHVSTFTDDANEIEITCQLKNTQFIFKTCNTFEYDGISNKSGIGLANIQKRLELTYPGSYTLKCEAIGNRFKTELKLNIK